MGTAHTNPLTELMTAAARGDSGARERFWSAVYDKLHGMADWQLIPEAVGRAPGSTTLIHKAYQRLTAKGDVEWANRAHFFGAAANAMRQVRVDYARERDSIIRGGDKKRVAIPESLAVLDQDPAEVLALDKALDKLERRDPRKAKVVMFRYFAGLTGDETARALKLSPRTVDSDWRVARAWLHRELSKGDTSVV